MTKTGSIIKKYLTAFPSMTSTELAEKIYEENLDSFNKSESVRSMIRYYRGKSGKKHFKSLIPLDFIQEHKSTIKKIPNVLIFDIETSPMVCYAWGLFKQTIPHNQIVRPWHIISWAARWLYDSEVMSDVITPEEAVNGNDKRVSGTLLKLFNEADIIIAHNAKKFDDKRAKTRFLLNDYNPPSPYQIIDTLEQSRKEFAFSSNRLDYLGRMLNNNGKIDTNFGLWEKCMNFQNKFSRLDQQEALNYMLKYNIEDVFILEEYYLFIRPWIKNHPNMGIYQESTESVCYKCGSPDIIPEGEYVTPLNRYHTMRCKNCGGIAGRERITAMGKKQKDSLISPIPR
jgi:hypothetical protein